LEEAFEALVTEIKKTGRKLSITLLSQSFNHFRDRNGKLKLFHKSIYNLA